MEVTPLNLKQKVLWPFVIGSALLFAVLVSSVYRLEKKQIEEDFSAIQKTFLERHRELVQSRAERLTVVANVITNDEELGRAMEANDRARLLGLSKFRFNAMREAFGVTHWYFHDAHLKNVLRLQKPERYGDATRRFTAEEAARTGAVTHGIELEPHGVLVLRAVAPWRRGDKIVGYVEVGEEIQNLASSMGKLLNIDLAVLIGKSHVVREDWEAGNRMLGRRDQWDALPDEVVSLQTNDKIVPLVRQRLRASSFPGEHVPLAGKDYMVGAVPFSDVSQRAMGRIVIVQDVTARMADFHDIVLTMTGASLLVGPMLLALFYSVLERAERQLYAWRTRVTEESCARARLQEQHIRDLEHAALNDSLTGLPNRKLLHEQLNSVLAANENKSVRFGLLLFNLQHLSEINDALGHDIGDAVLRHVADRLREGLTRANMIARHGGDEFALVFLDVEREDAVAIMSSVQAVLAPTFHLQGIVHEVRANLGMAFYPHDGDNALTLMRCADVAMRQAKRSRNNIALYDSREDPYTVRRLTLLSELRHAIDHANLEVYYQAQVDVATGEIVAAEALVRWMHPSLGQVSPEEFIPLAEQSGLIKLFTRWVLARAFADQATWRAEGFEIAACVNLSAQDLTDPLLPDYVATLISIWKACSSCITIEITEGAVIVEPERALEVLQRFAAMGIRASIDDFGTGYSSLTYLKRLPARELKVDRSFVAGMCSDENDANIVASTIQLAHALGLEVVAEGVEDRATLKALADLGCERIQGFFVSPPLPASDFLNQLRTVNGNVYHAGAREAVGSS